MAHHWVWLVTEKQDRRYKRSKPAHLSSRYFSVTSINVGHRLMHAHCCPRQQALKMAGGEEQ